MFTKALLSLSLALLLAVQPLAPLFGQEAAIAEDDQWPRTVTAGDTVFRIYQPLMDSWDGYSLRAHSAIAVQAKTDGDRLSYGVADFTAQTEVDTGTRRVRFDDVRVQRVRFPSDPGREQPYLRALSAAVPSTIAGVPLSKLEESRAILDEEKKAKAPPLRSAPPKIIFSSVPAVLVYIDGTPVFAPVKGTTLSRVVNTQALLLKHASGKLYLRVFDGYLEAGKTEGPWKVSKMPPADAQKAEALASDVLHLDLMRGEPDPATGAMPSLVTDRAPVVYAVSEPTELIVTDGEPDYVPVTGTSLLYVSNTTANVFKNIDDQKTYLLASGRWFSAPSTKGPWKYVPAAGLPNDFAAIPDESAKESVKASVAGTPQAEEAAIADRVPMTAKVERGTSEIPLEIDGKPQLRRIDGTPLSYVFNASMPIIRVDARTWYAVYNGVWYEATGAGGPWAVAARVPAVIYSIPVNSPLHHVTYVRVYDATPGYVYVGYTRGYYGTVICPDGTVVYGTGYVYPAYIGRSVWFYAMPTYGWGTTLCWTPRYSWSFGFGYGWGYRDLHWYPDPFWGPFHHRRYRLPHRGYRHAGGNLYHMRSSVRPAQAPSPRVPHAVTYPARTTPRGGNRLQHGRTVPSSGINGSPRTGRDTGSYRRAERSNTVRHGAVTRPSAEPRSTTRSGNVSPSGSQPARSGNAGNGNVLRHGRTGK